MASTLVRGLNESGHTAELFDLPKPGASWRWPLKALTLPGRAAAFGEVALRLRRADPLLIHVHYASQGMVGIMAGRPYVVHCHGTDIRGVVAESRWHRLISPAMQRAVGVMYSTPDLASAARLFRRDATFLPNPVDTDTFRPGSSPERDVLVGIRLDATKGAEIALEAIRRLVASRRSVTVTIVRSGSLDERDYDDLGAAVRWIAPVSHREMPDLFRKHRIALGQFAGGAIGVYELEAMACGLPVVADFTYADTYADTSPLQSIAQEDRAGSAAQEMGRLLDDPVLLRSQSAEGRDWVVRHHGLLEVAGRLLTYYKTLGIGLSVS